MSPGMESGCSQFTREEMRNDPRYLMYNREMDN